MSDGIELIGGRERRAIEIVEYDPSWPEVFAREQARICDALGATAFRVDHIGSTSVAGLAAKPIVDIAISVESPEDERHYLPMLEQAGFHLRVREPDHRMLRTAAQDVHVHVWAAGGDWERRHLLFRDWLRLDAADRRRYVEVKRSLAERDWPDMNAYAEAKSETVEGIMARAERWAAETSWAVS